MYNDILDKIQDWISNIVKSHVVYGKKGDYLNGYVDACEDILNYCEGLKKNLNNG